MAYTIRDSDALVFDDLMLVPQYSDIKHRADIDLSVYMGPFKFSHPLIPSNMKSLFSREMIAETIKCGGLSVLHRFMPIEEQIQIATETLHTFGPNNFAVSIGIKDGDKNNVHDFVELGIKILCLDVAHSDSPYCIDMIKWLKDKYSDIFVIAGNVSTGIAAKRMWAAGADAVKVGQGCGSICTTRIMTGNGVPLLSALIDIKTAQLEMKDDNAALGAYIISDGGCKIPGDVVKSCCFSDMVMAGNLFAACNETEGSIIEIEGVSYKEYAGSSTHKSTHVEGVSSLVKCKGKYADVLGKILEGLRSGCSYQGAHNLTELKENPEFVRITNAGFTESNAHDVKVVR
jgi:IMP dehydrogenase